MRLYHLLALIFLIVIPLRSQQVLKVLDADSGNPISNLYVYCEEARASSNNDGEILFRDIEKCLEFNFQHPAYERASFTLDQLQAKNFVIYLNESSINLINIEFSYSKWEQKKEETPITTSTITKKDIEFNNPQTSADLLAQSGKVFVQKSQLGGGSPMIRGFSTSRVLLVVDGVRMNTAIFREGNVQNVISLDPNAIERTEVVFGPGAVIYGSDAIGGVMSFTTLKPKFSFGEKPKFNLQYLGRYTTGNSEKTAHVDFDWSTEKLASVSSLSFSNFGDQIMGSFGPNDYLRNHIQGRVNGRDATLVNSDPTIQKESGYSQFNIMQKVLIKTSNTSELNLGFHASSTTDVPRYDRLIQYSGIDTLRNAEWYYGPQTWLMQNISYTSRKRQKLFDNFKAGLSYQYFKESRNDRRMFSSSLRQRTETVHAVNATIDFDKTYSSKTHFYYGFENVFNRVGSKGIRTNIEDQSTEATNTRYPDGSTWDYSSFYGSMRYRINPELTLNTGFRLNSIFLNGTVDTSFFPLPVSSIDNNFSAVNGSAGLSYSPDDKWQWNLNLSNGFRAPNIDDISKIFDSSPGTVVIPNSDLKPEFLYAADFSLAYKPNKKTHFEIGLYYSYLQNALARAAFTLNGQDSIIYDGELSQVQAVQNIDAATVWGLQGSMEINLAKDLNFRANAHYNNGETEDGDALRHVSPFFTSAHLVHSYKIAQIDLYGMYNGPVNYDRLAPNEREKAYLYASDSDGNPYSPSWFTLNLRVQLELSKKLNLQLGLENITDQRYRPYSSGISAVGRSVSLTIRGQL